MTSPYEVLAVGDPDALQNGFVNSEEARYLVNLALTYDWEFTFNRADDLELPGASSTELRSARPLEPESAPASGTPTPSGPDDGGD